MVMSSKYPGKYRETKEHLLVYCELIRAARHRGTVTFQEVAEIMGLRLSGAYMAAEVGHMIGAISVDEHGYGRPMLSAIVVNVRGLPGKGFFDLARELGRLQDDSKESEHRFWEEEKKAVYATWQRDFKSER